MVRGVAISLAMAVVASSALPGAAHAADAERGRRLYAACGYCHGAKGTGGPVGPTLKGVFGRQVGTVPKFNYSPAMKSAGFTWTEQNMGAFLRDPKSQVKGTRMVYPGLKNPKDVEDIIAFMKQIK